MNELLALRERSLYHVTGGIDVPAVYYLVDRRAGGVLINTPAFDESLLNTIETVAPIRYLFIASPFGAADVALWRRHTGASALAWESDDPTLNAAVDPLLQGVSKLTRTIELIPLGGRTRGNGILWAKDKPGIVFFGPALEPGPDGWPSLIAHSDDYDWEDRVIGALGLQELNYEYALTDVYHPGKTPIGPGAARSIARGLDRTLAIL